MEWRTVDQSISSEQEFYWLWILATTTYGVGDVVTTIALVFYAPAVRESNPLVSMAMGTLGLGGLVALKLAVFFGCLGLSVYAMHAWRDRFVYGFPPFVLTLVGLWLTAVNLALLA